MSKMKPPRSLKKLSGPTAGPARGRSAQVVLARILLVGGSWLTFMEQKGGVPPASARRGFGSVEARGDKVVDSQTEGENGERQHQDDRLPQPRAGPRRATKVGQEDADPSGSTSAYVEGTSRGRAEGRGASRLVSAQWLGKEVVRE